MYYPLRSLREGNWFKLICGASFQHLPSVRNLTLAYALAGIDCVDVAADPAVISAARSGLAAASNLMQAAQERGFQADHLPWLMVSLNDGEDPHFRKAEFDPRYCPEDCTRPCERVCPAEAIAFTNSFSGVIDSRCYGCGRCLPICPIQQITTRSYVYAPAAIAPLVLDGVDAVEIHTQVGRYKDFERLWRGIEPFGDRLKLIAISCPDGEGLIDYLRSLYELLSPLSCPVVWQTDGRPMSGDIGDGATRATVKLGQKVLMAGLPGYVQLAGGTNSHTVSKLRALNLLNLSRVNNQDSKTASTHQSFEMVSQPRYISGIGFGSYARVLLSPVLDQLEKRSLSEASSLQAGLEAFPDLLWEAVTLADSLVSPLKSPMKQTAALSP